MLAIAIFYAASSIKTQTGQPALIKNINIGKSGGLPSLPEIAVSSNGTYAYITNDRLATVSVLSTSNDTIVDTLKIGEPGSTFPKGITITPDNRYVYIAACRFQYNFSPLNQK